MTIREENGWLIDDRGNRYSNEYWMAVPGYRGLYEVSTSGRVRSCDRVNINRNGVRRVLRGKMLSLSCDSEGYAQVGLLRNGVEVKTRVHRIVGTAFIKNPQNLPIVDHRNRVRRDNRVLNLRWATFSQNRKNSSAVINPCRFFDTDEAALADMAKMAERG